MAGDSGVRRLGEVQPRKAVGEDRYTHKPKLPSEHCDDKPGSDEPGGPLFSCSQVSWL